MRKQNKILAIIPARGNSKRCPGKNIANLCGKPLIAWTINAALASRKIDKVIVSTDNANIARIGKQYGADVPFMRPRVLASSSARVIDAVIHAIRFFENIATKYDIVALLQPTSPLRTSYDIDNAIQLLCRRNVDSIVSVCRSECNPDWMYSRCPDGILERFFARKRNNVQMQKVYRLNGAIYVSRVDYLLKKKTFNGAKTFAYVMPQERSVDIDTSFDFNYAAFLLNMKNSRKGVTVCTKKSE